MKKEYEILNKVEIDISQYNEEKVDELEKKRMMNKFKKSKKKRMSNKKIIVAAVVLFIVVNIGMNGQSVLAIGETFKNNISTFLGVQTKYSSEIGETIKSGDIELTLNEFFTDNSRIVINFDINLPMNECSEIIKDKTGNKLFPDIYIKGEKVEINDSYSGFSMRPKDDIEDSNITSLVIDIRPKNLDLTEKENVKLVFSNLAKSNKINEDKFTYAFDFDINNYMKDSKVIDVNKKIDLEGNSLSIDKVIVSPDRVTILGNEDGLSQWKNTNTKEAKYYYEIVKQNGEELYLKANLGEGAYFYNQVQNATSINIIPYTFEPIDTEKTEIDYEGRTRYIIEDKIITINLE